MPCRCHQWLLPIAVCLLSWNLAVGSPVKTVCPKGFYQEEVIVLSCEGGKGRQSMILSSQAAPQGQFSWEVGKDTYDLSLEVLCEPLKSLHGSAKLSAKCAEPHGEVILGENKGLLNQSAKHMVNAHGAQWSWSGDVPRKHSGPFSLWLRVQGKLHCNVEFLLHNDQDSNLAVDVRYKWSEIKPCPKQLKGCSLCPTDKCHQQDVAVCDGSPYWECLPKEAVMKLNATAGSEGELPGKTTELMTTATSTTMTTTTRKSLSLDELMEDPHVQSLLREEQKVNQPALPSGPMPTSHPAVPVPNTDALRAGNYNFSTSPQDMHQSRFYLPWVNGVVLGLCVLLMAAFCMRSAEPSEQVRGQLGAAIQGQRTPYAPIDGDAPEI